MSSTPCRPSKRGTGCLPFPLNCSCPTFHRDIAMCEASWRSQLPDTNIGSSSHMPQPRFLSSQFEQHSDLYMPNPPDLELAESTCGKKKPESPVPSLNSVNSPSGETPKLTGMPSSWLHGQGPLSQSPLTYKFVVTTNCDALVQTMYNLCLWNDLLKFSGAELGLGKVVSHGKKQGSRLTLKIREPSGGMVTWVKLTLSSMNSVGPLTSRICCDGLIGTQYEWRTKVDQCHCQLQGFGLRRTLIQGCGIRMWTQKQLTP